MPVELAPTFGLYVYTGKCNLLLVYVILGLGLAFKILRLGLALIFRIC